MIAYVQSRVQTDCLRLHASRAAKTRARIRVVARGRGPFPRQCRAGAWRRRWGHVVRCHAGRACVRTACAAIAGKSSFQRGWSPRNPPAVAI